KIDDGTVFAYNFSSLAQWSSTGSGNWSANGNWSTSQGNTVGTPGVRGNTGDTATFGSIIGNRSATITLDVPVTLSAITFSNTGAGNYTLVGGGSNTLTMDNSGSGATIAVTAGSPVIDAPVVLVDNLIVSGSGTLTFGNSS